MPTSSNTKLGPFQIGQLNEPSVLTTIVGTGLCANCGRMAWFRRTEEAHTLLCTECVIVVIRALKIALADYLSGTRTDQYL